MRRAVTVGPAAYAGRVKRWIVGGLVLVLAAAAALTVWLVTRSSSDNSSGYASP